MSEHPKESPSGVVTETYGIEVFPGVFRELRGLEETWEALKMGLCTEITCLECDMRLVCVQDCDCVMCPQCHSMSPVESKCKIPGAHIGGVGVGLFIE